MKRRRLHIDSVKSEQIIDTGEDSLIAGQAERKYENTVKDLENQACAIAPTAVGVAMNSCADTSAVIERRSISNHKSSEPSPSPMEKTRNLARRLLKRSSSLGSASDAAEKDLKRIGLMVIHGTLRFE